MSIRYNPFEIPEDHIAAYRSGNYKIAEKRVRRVFDVLVHSGNMVPHFRTTIKELATRTGESKAAIRRALFYLQYFDYIDVGTDNLDYGRYGIFVRFGKWLGMGKKVTCASFDKDSRIWGHPFKWGDRDVCFRDWVLQFFDGAHALYKRQGSHDWTIRNATQEAIAGKWGVGKGGHSHEATDILNTWGQLEKYRDGKLPVYKIRPWDGSGSLLTSPHAGGFTYAKLPQTPPFPKSGYLHPVNAVQGKLFVPTEATGETEVESPVQIGIQAEEPKDEAAETFFDTVDGKYPPDTTEEDDRRIRYFFRHSVYGMGEAGEPVERKAQPGDRGYLRGDDTSGSSRRLWATTVEDALNDQKSPESGSTGLQGEVYPMLLEDGWVVNADVPGEKLTETLLDMAMRDRADVVGEIVGILNRLEELEVIELKMVSGFLGYRFRK